MRKTKIICTLGPATDNEDVLRKLLQNGGTVGRKLDFLVQEMNREINTMGSKSASTDLRWLVVDGKTLLERIREQVQNVE